MIGETLAEWVMTSKVVRWACVIVTWLVALVGFAYLADAFPRRGLGAWISLAVGVALVLGFWVSLFALIEDARKDGEAAAKLREDASNHWLDDDYEDVNDDEDHGDHGEGAALGDGGLGADLVGVQVAVG